MYCLANSTHTALRAAVELMSVCEISMVHAQCTYAVHVEQEALNLNFLSGHFDVSYGVGGQKIDENLVLLWTHGDAGASSYWSLSVVAGCTCGSSTRVDRYTSCRTLFGPPHAAQ